MERYLLYQELADYLRAVEQAVPHLVRLFSIGTSFEGRPLLLAEVTNRGTREGLEKPAIWLDGNSRAGEVATSTACLEVLRQLAAAHGRDELITELLDHCTFYIVPRVAADGAERCLTTGDRLNSGVRPYPYEEAIAGLLPSDVDGDGWIRQMRIPDPLGEWKPSKRDERLLVRRNSDDRRGTFYRLYREGVVSGTRARPVVLPLGKESLDFDRNYPRKNWKLEVQKSGPFPLSENETRAVADFFRSHPNVFCAVTCRTQGGYLEHPRTDGMPLHDRRLYELLSERLEEASGLEAFETEEGQGGFVEWAYHDLGMLAFAPVLWSLPRAAGLELGSEPRRYYQERDEAESLAILRWLDRECEGRGFAQWKPFEHPQFGKVEIGGWDVMSSWVNPPPGRMLKEEVQRYVKLVLTLAAASPRLTLARVQDEVVGRSLEEEPLRRIRVSIENRGYLSSQVTQRAVETAAALPGEVEVTCDENARLMIGESRKDIGQFAGTGSIHAQFVADGISFRGCDEKQRQGLEWLVKGAGEVKFVVRHDRGGFLHFASKAAPEPLMPAAPPAATGRKTPAPAPPPPPPGRKSGAAIPAAPTESLPAFAPAARRQTPERPPVVGEPPAVVAQAPEPPSPFPPAKQQGSGRVFGQPPAKPPTLNPRSLPTEKPSKEGADFSPLPLAQGAETREFPEPPGFEPLPVTPAAAPPKRRPQMAQQPVKRPLPTGPAESPPQAPPPEADFPMASPPKPSQIPAPLLIRRSRPRKDR